jgi:triacylglycerol lipase
MSLNLKSRTVIFVHGIFGWGGNELLLSYWGEALAQFPRARFDVHEVKCGPVSSFHDRACELFAQIRGGDFKYGNGQGDGTKRSVVARAERKHVSQDHPIVLVGHSAGAHTCLALQQLLAEDFFGVGSTADWIEAIICISGVLNGSMLTYMFGCDPVTGILSREPERLIGTAVKLANLLPQLPQAGIDPWLEQWTDKNAFARGRDNLAHDLTLSGCLDANAGFATNSTTYYLSLVTSMPARRTVLGIPLPLRFPGINLLLQGTAIYQADRADFVAGALPLPNWNTTPELQIAAWRENDGAVSTISQLFPFTHRQEPIGQEGFLGGQSIEKGRWYFERVENVVGRSLDHLDPVFGVGMKPGATAAHRKLYQSLAGLLD